VWFIPTRHFEPIIKNISKTVSAYPCETMH
jgi:hypothetical protein